MKDRDERNNASTSYTGRYVFPDDAEDIKAHRWFRNVPWDRLQTLSPPFVPRLHTAEDTHYFDESEPIEDWSESAQIPPVLSPEDVRTILIDFRESVQNLAMQLVVVPYDPSRLRHIDQQISAVPHLEMEEKEVLKQFVRLYGRKEQKRPRDKLLRDDQTRDVVMNVRKQTAFQGYTWRRMRPGGYVTPMWA